MLNKWKKRVHHFLYEEQASKSSQRVLQALGALIILNLVVLVLESVRSLHEQYGPLFRAIEYISIFIFTIEYLLRLWVSSLDGGPIKGRLKFAFSPMGLIDLFAILPAYLPLLNLDLRFLRTLRLLRLFRVFKLARYNHAVQNLLRVVREKQHELAVAMMLGLLLLTLSSCLMYFCENEAQPDKFPSIPHAMWYSVATLTTVGYGDVYPITTLGKIFGAMTAFLGVGMFALPAAILASGFSETLENKKKSCPHCGK